MDKQITWLCLDCWEVFDGEHPANYPHGCAVCPECEAEDTIEECGVAV